MAQSFRLVEIIAKEVAGQKSESHPPSHDRIRKVVLSDDDADTSSWVSVIIGKNGVGKSRLLASVAAIFDAVNMRRRPRRNLGFHTSKMRYVADGRVYTVGLDVRGNLRATQNGKRCRVDELTLPTKVIALTTTPFDKFRVPLSFPPREGSKELDDKYVYLGLRDRSGRASPRHAVFRAVEGLFEASRAHNDRRFRIAEVFGFLGYSPFLDVRYELTQSESKRLASFIAGELPPSEHWYRHERFFKANPEAMDAVQKAGQRLLARLENGEIEPGFWLRADFRSGSASDYAHFRDVHLLSRAGFIRLRAVEVERTGGIRIDLTQASSGELGIVTGFLSLASVIEEGSLIFVDEPQADVWDAVHHRWVDEAVDRAPAAAIV